MMDGLLNKMKPKKLVLLFPLVAACSGVLEQPAAVSDEANASSQALVQREANAHIIERVRADLPEISRARTPQERNRGRSDR
jgi:hypothetical protein